MGLLDAARAVSVDERGFAYVDAAGHRVAEMPVEAFDGGGLVAEVELQRGDLVRLLYEATREDTEYVFTDSITALDQDADGVTAHFEHRAQARFDLVVGADGLHSQVRALTFGPEERLVRSLGLAMAFATVPNRYDLGGWFVMHSRPGVVLGLRPDRDPEYAKAMFGMISPPPELHQAGRAYHQAILARAFADMGWLASQVLADLPASPDLHLDNIGQVHLPTWSAGRIGLVGDAACCPSPLTGMGTSLALVGAYVLAGELAVTGRDHEAGFASYESVMRPYVTKAQDLPPGGSRGFAPPTRIEIALRNRATRWMTRWPIRNPGRQAVHQGRLDHPAGLSQRPPWPPDISTIRRVSNPATRVDRLRRWRVGRVG